MSVIIRSAALALLLGCVMPTSADLNHDVPTIQFHWNNGIKQLADCGVTTYLEWSDFKWRAHDYPFKCGDVIRSGCYTISGLIEYYVEEPDAIRHETGHAVLHRMGYRDWDIWQHGTDPCLP